MCNSFTFVWEKKTKSSMKRPVASSMCTTHHICNVFILFILLYPVLELFFLHVFIVFDCFIFLAFFKYLPLSIWVESAVIAILKDQTMKHWHSDFLKTLYVMQCAGQQVGHLLPSPPTSGPASAPLSDSMLECQPRQPTLKCGRHPHRHRNISGWNGPKNFPARPSLPPAAKHWNLTEIWSLSTKAKALRFCACYFFGKQVSGEW